MVFFGLASTECQGGRPLSFFVSISFLFTGIIFLGRASFSFFPLLLKKKSSIVVGTSVLSQVLSTNII